MINIVQKSIEMNQGSSGSCFLVTKHRASVHGLASKVLKFPQQYAINNNNNGKTSGGAGPFRDGSHQINCLILHHGSLYTVGYFPRRLYPWSPCDQPPCYLPVGESPLALSHRIPSHHRFSFFYGLCICRPAEARGSTEGDVTCPGEHAHAELDHHSISDCISPLATQILTSANVLTCQKKPAQRQNPIRLYAGESKSSIAPQLKAHQAKSSH